MILAIEAIEELGYQKHAYKFNGRSKSEAMALAKELGIDISSIIDDWDTYIHVKSPVMKCCFAMRASAICSTNTTPL